MIGPLELDDNWDDVLVAVPCLEATDGAFSHLIHVHFQWINHHEARLVKGQIIAG